MGSKYLIASRSDDSQKEITDITFPIIKRYASACDAEFITIVDPRDLHHHYRIMQFYELFEHYDRILSLDSDILILKGAPNIFDVVPEDKIGTIFEDVGSRKEDRRERIRMIQEEFGDVDWKSGYINTGVAVFSKCHREIFAPSKKLWLNLGYDDVYLGWKIGDILRDRGQIHELSYKFNHMSLFSENGNVSRFDSYIIHYAGQGGFLSCRSRLECITEDKLVLEKYGMLFEERKLL